VNVKRLSPQHSSSRRRQKATNDDPGGYKGYVLRLRRAKTARARIIEIFGPACSDFALSTATTVAEAKRWIDGYIDLEQTIDDLVYRKKNLDLDSAEYQFIDRVLSGLRYSCEEAGGIIEDLDPFGWGATCRPLAATPAQGPRRVLPFSRAAKKKAKKRSDKTRP
jgi:hypothetical protein